MHSDSQPPEHTAVSSNKDLFSFVIETTVVIKNTIYYCWQRAI